MRTELTFLLELFLDEEVPSGTKKKLAERIKEVEEGFSKPATTYNMAPRQAFVPGLSEAQAAQVPNNPLVAVQSPSMQRLMASNPDLIPAVPVPPTPATPAAAEALKQRAAIMRNGMSEKPEPGRTSPRKF